MYFRIPLEQGLRPIVCFGIALTESYFRIPLEQGLRRMYFILRVSSSSVYFRIPLEQGLRHRQYCSHKM